MPADSQSDASSESVFGFLDNLLGQDAHVDYGGAWNGLQVEGPARLRVVATAVDASERILLQAREEEADLLVVHHGLFWDPNPRLVGPRYRKTRLLLKRPMALYASHLPLDRHPEVGNAALLLKALDLPRREPFGEWKGLHVGWSASIPDGSGLAGRTDFARRLEEVVSGPVQVIPGGPSRVRQIAVVTGGGASFLADAADRGLDTLITGEAPHHAFAEAMERGVNLLLAGHYRTETLGVRAVGERLADAFGLRHVFLDDPSGL